MLLFRLQPILGEKWHKLRANIRKSLIDQFNGLAELKQNWLYNDSQNNDICIMPMSQIAVEVSNAHTT